MLITLLVSGASMNLRFSYNSTHLEAEVGLVAVVLVVFAVFGLVWPAGAADGTGFLAVVVVVVACIDTGLALASAAVPGVFEVLV